MKADYWVREKWMCRYVYVDNTHMHLCSWTHILPTSWVSVVTVLWCSVGEQTVREPIPIKSVTLCSSIYLNNFKNTFSLKPL